MIRSVFLYLTLLLTPATLIRAADNSCCPCGTSDEECSIPASLGRAFLPISGTAGATCLDPKGSCNFSPLDIRRCCDANVDPSDSDVAQKEPTPEVDDPQALVNQECPHNCNEPVCHVCWRSEGRPRNYINGRIAALHVPNLPGQTSNTCGQLYELGLAGGVPARMCRVVQDFIAEKGTCNCPEDNGNGNGNGNSNGNNDQQQEQENSGNGNEDIRTTLEELLKENGGESLKAQFMEQFTLARKSGNRVRRRNLKGGAVAGKA